MQQGAQIEFSLLLLLRMRQGTGFEGGICDGGLVIMGPGPLALST
jgi:hypothetical protein